MLDPNDDTTPSTTDPHGSHVESPSGSVSDNADGPGQPLEINEDLPLIDPTGGEGS